MKIALSHPTGNQFVRALISALLEANMLTEFGTTLAIDPEALWLKALPIRMHKEWLRRTFAVKPKQLWTHPLLELARRGISRLRLNCSSTAYLSARNICN
jgi:hypothetical protein